MNLISIFRHNWLLVMLLFILSCDRHIEGAWILELNSSSNFQGIDLIKIHGDNKNVSIIDSHGVNYDGEYNELNNVITINTYVTTPTVISNIYIVDSVMTFDSCIYKRINDSRFDSTFSISILPIGSNNNIDFKTTRKRKTYPISMKSIDETEYVLKLGDRVTTIDELPFYLHCYHCEKVEKSVIIFIDQKVRLEHLFEVYQYLDRQFIRNRQVVTGIHEIGVYKGFRDEITIWQEQRELLASQVQSLYPTQIGAYRHSWIENEDVCLVNGNEIASDFNISALQHSSDCEYVLINTYDIQYAVDYLKLKEIINSQSNHKEVSKDGKLNNDNLSSSYVNDTLPKISTITVYEYYGGNKVNK